MRSNSERNSAVQAAVDKMTEADEQSAEDVEQLTAEQIAEHLRTRR